MKTFFNVEDIGDLQKALAEAQEVKRDRFAFQSLGKNKTLLMIRLSMKNQLKVKLKKNQKLNSIHQRIAYI